MADEDEKLLPCPFCGDEAEIEQMGDRRKSMVVACTNCGCRLESSDQGTPNMWNRRAGVAHAKGRAGELAERIAKLQRYEPYIDGTQGSCAFMREDRHGDWLKRDRVFAVLRAASLAGAAAPEETEDKS